MVSITQTSSESANVSLIRAGALGCSPTQPTVAVTLECLELYHQLRRRRSSISIQAIAKTLCALHNMTYTHHLRVQLSTAFDVYLEILRRIRASLNHTLGRAGPTWKLRGACPCCAFTQPDEPVLSPARLHSMDGNFSTKRLDGSGHTDLREFASNYFVPEDQVNQFKDDVRQRTRGDGGQGHCGDNWRAANPGEEDQVKVFTQTGIFLLACRHGFVECVIEMKNSGELAKYSLAAVNQVLEVCGKNQGIGHDIGCASKSTVASSSLGPKAAELNLQIVVNAFHGFAHNRTCQLDNHPLYLRGFGNEDLETCERIFSSSNSTAPLIRHASYFHWKQFIDLHFDQWDQDKYLELGKFLIDNYRQALRIIDQYTKQLQAFKRTTGFTDEDFEQWYNEEKTYLHDCAKEPKGTALAVEYVELLQKFQFADHLCEHVNGAFPDVHTGAIYSRHTSALRKYQLMANAVEHFEKVNGITTRWTPDDPEYKASVDYVKHRAFIRTVEELEGLLASYKMRKHISKALTRRSATIRAAIERYNKLAPRQKPPRPKLEYTEVIGYASLGDFALLKTSRSDILTKPWVVATNRELMMKYFKVLRSREEIDRLNVEVHRLAIWVDFDEEKIRLSMAKLKLEDSPYLAAEMAQFLAERQRVNGIHRSRGVRPCGGGVLVPNLEEVVEDDEDDEPISNDQALLLAECLDRVS
ncbi:hypothetical protein L210DRAFT_3609890 [Boletus edulis BED1]|uniref:CxC2-like cysteine cluster KDZ transposase-associated domain-containing protein n=1 Tax=Boletus edulis BED1 TaxID=1328754 RepID=A0AAD4GIS3_BOLED|nr:hypothetical protein L210DRAFT_3609890 [Boletus edulis BED1]